MKKLICLSLFFVFGYHMLWAQIPIDAGDVATFSQASQGDLYLDDNGVYYIGLEDGSLKELGIVTEKGATDGQVLVWDAANGKWIAGTASGSGKPSTAGQVAILQPDLEFTNLPGITPFAIGYERIQYPDISEILIADPPLTIWPENGSPPDQLSSIYRNVAVGDGRFYENAVLGQTTIWRIDVEYNKSTASGNNDLPLGVVIRVTIPGTGFDEQIVQTSPRALVTGNLSFLIVTVADATSIANGLVFEIGIDDPDSSVTVKDILRVSLQN